MEAMILNVAIFFPCSSVTPHVFCLAGSAGTKSSNRVTTTVLWTAPTLPTMPPEDEGETGVDNGDIYATAFDFLRTF